MPTNALDILLDRDEHGAYVALIAVGNDTVEVTRRFGSWSTVPDANGRYRGLLPHVAAALQAEVRALGESATIKRAS